MLIHRLDVIKHFFFVIDNGATKARVFVSDIFFSPELFQTEALYNGLLGWLLAFPTNIRPACKRLAIEKHSSLFRSTEEKSL